MKIPFQFILWLAIAVAPAAMAQDNTSPQASAEIKAHIEKLRGHPRILFLREEEAGLKSALKADPYKKTVHEAILAECTRLLDTPPLERNQVGRRLLGVSRECLRRVFQLAYAWRMTGNGAFLERAEKELTAVSGFTDWNPSHFLDVAEMTLAVAIGYDWLYSGLTPAGKATIKEAILEKGIKPSLDKRYNGFLKSGNNWNQVCNAGMLFGVLAIAEDEPGLAAEIVARSIGSLPVSVRHYAPDGAYPEGYSYWEYGTSFNVLLLSALEKAFGTDFGLSSMPGFMDSGSYLQHMTGPSLLVHNWGDCGVNAGVSTTLFWYAGKLKDPSLLWMNRRQMDQDTGGLVRNRLLPTFLIWGKDINLSLAGPPARQFWTGGGPSPVALMRTGWKSDQEWFAGFKAGSASVSHAHMDAGSFVLDALGERWAMDFGSQNYHSLESKGVQLWGREQDAQRWEVFRYNNRVHNTLTIDDQLHRVKGHANIDRWSDNPEQMFAISDLSAVFEGQAEKVTRGIALRNGKEMLVRDEVEAPSGRAITIRWNLLTGAGAEIQDAKTVRLTRNGKTMYLHFDSDLPLILKTWSTEPAHDYDAPNPGTVMVGFEARVPAGSKPYFNVLFSTDRKDPGEAPELRNWK